MGTGKLESQAKIFITQQLAMYERPQVIRDAVKEIYSVEISLPSILHYDISNPTLPPKWREIFEQTREKFLSDVSIIPIANKSYRLKELNRIYTNQAKQAEKLQNPVEMRATLEQAAKESGDAFTNKRIIDLNDVSKLSDEELQSVVNSKG